MSKRKTFKDVVFHLTWNNSTVSDVLGLWDSLPEKDAPNNEYEGHLHVLENTILEMSNNVDFDIIRYAYSKTNYEIGIYICEAMQEWCEYEQHICGDLRYKELIKCLRSMRRKYVLGKSRESRINKRIKK